MSIFWKYFTKTLRFPMLLKSEYLALLAKGAAACLDIARDNILWLRNQFLVSKTEEQNIAQFATSRSIKRFPNEPADVYKKRVQFAYLWHKQGGKNTGMKTAMSALGFDDIIIINMRSIDSKRWAEFSLELAPVTGNILNLFDVINWLINEVKPARSICTDIEFKISLPAAVVSVSTVLLIGITTQIYPYQQSNITLTPITLGVCGSCQTTISTTIYPR